jgi:SAM-dependent methyltransferase
VQPLLARAVLPWFGGAASVWTTSLLFYQTLLFGGYAYAHFGGRLGPRRQALLHAALLVATWALLPITVAESWKPVGPEAPTLRLLGLLTMTVGAPYFLLAGTTPLLHDWFGRRSTGRSPYKLYAVSNAGSLLALLLYPAVLEPFLTLRHQAVVWSVAYTGLGVGVVGLVWMLGRVRTPGRGDGGEGQDAPDPVRFGDRVMWVLLAACGSALLLAITNTITMDVASVPLLWVVPLALYLTTFILAFAGLYRRGTWGALLVLAIGATGVLWAGGFALPTLVQVGMACAILFVGCMVCHGELARSAPAAEGLTGFYLTMAGGGALGGLSVAVVAPLLLSDFWEFPGAVLAAFGLLLVSLHRDPPRLLAARGGGFVIGTLGTVLLGAAWLFAAPSTRNARGTVAVERNFYGVLRVQDRPPGVLHEMRVMRHGRIFHGADFLDPARRGLPTAYFTRGSGVEQAIRTQRERQAGAPIRVGVIGLGVGTLAAWTEDADTMRFYEINPAAERLARRDFSFLDGARGTVDVVLGDGRLALERDLVDAAGEPLYDVVVVDAFSGDAVPVHLLTLEALSLYRRVLRPGGVLVFQITNRHVDLERVVRGLAEASGLSAVRIDQDPKANSGGVPNSWMLLAEPGTALPAERRRSGTEAGAPVLWTDDFSNLLRVLR